MGSIDGGARFRPDGCGLFFLSCPAVSALAGAGVELSSEDLSNNPSSACGIDAGVSLSDLLIPESEGDAEEGYWERASDAIRSLTMRVFFADDLFVLGAIVMVAEYV